MKSAPHEAASASESDRSEMNGSEAASSKAAEEAKRHEDDNLVKRCRNGDRAAFQALYERYNKRVYFVALGVVKNAEDAQDVVQEAFIKVHRNIDGFQGNSSFYTWLYRIVKNLAIDHIRRRKHVTEFDEKFKKDDVVGDGSLLPRIMDQHPGKTVGRRELSEQIQRALESLPEHHREVLILRESDGLSYEEIAELVDIPKGTVMSRLFHARKKMQAALAGYIDGDLDITE